MRRGLRIRCRVKLTEDCLGTVPYNRDVYRSHIVTKVDKALEVNEGDRLKAKVEEGALAETDLKDVEEKGWTGFMQDKKGYYIFNYWLRGYLKSAVQSLMETGDLEKISAYKTKIDRFVFVNPRKVYFEKDGGGKLKGDLKYVERPLRAMTRLGPRVTVVRSDCVDAGGELEWEFELLPNKGITVDTLREAMEYGRYEGLGQWRSGGYGRFEVLEWEEVVE